MTVSRNITQVLSSVASPLEALLSLAVTMTDSMMHTMWWPRQPAGAPAIGIRMRVIGAGPLSLVQNFLRIPTHHQQTIAVSCNEAIRDGHFQRGVARGVY